MNAYDILGIERKPELTNVKSIGKRKRRQPRKNNNYEDDNDNKCLTGGGEENEPTNENNDNKLHAHGDRNRTEKDITPNLTVEKYEPKITRPTMSIFEYAETHTKLAEYLASLKSIKNFVDDVEIHGNVNPTELAFHLLKEGKWDATLDRGYELVSYSKLKINPQWEQMIENYFNAQHKTQKEELFEPLGLI